MLEYIAMLNFDTDGEWGYSQELRDALSNFKEDDAFKNPVAFFNTFADAIYLVTRTLDIASRNNGIFKADMGQSELDFLARLTDVKDIFIDLECNLDPAIIEYDIISGIGASGGVVVHMEWENWCVDAAVYIRSDGHMGYVEEIWF